MSNEVNRRNILALGANQKLQREFVEKLLTRVESLEKAVAMLETELQGQRQQLVVALMARGRGPTT